MMNFSYRLPVAIFGAAATIVMVQTQAVKAKSADEVNSIAKEITVLIREPNGNTLGSGVIIGTENNTYYVVTAGHVVPDEVEYEVVTSDGKAHPVTPGKFIRPVQYDLVILEFSSNDIYRVATLIDYDLSTKIWSNGIYVFVSGYLKGNNSQSSYLFTPGVMFDTDTASELAQEPFSGGYELLYSNITMPGVSGGPVLDTDGRVIGIHGRVDGRDDVQLGYSLGIPINKILRLLPPSNRLRIESSFPSQLNQQEVSSIQSLFNKVEVVAGGSNAGEWVNRGNQLIRLGRYEEAIACFEKAIQIQPNSYQAWYAKGWGLYRNGKYQQAIPVLEKATQLQPSFYPAWFWLGFAQSNLGKYQEAVKSYDKAIQIEPKLYQAWAAKGSALTALQKYEEALACYDTVVQSEMKPNYHIAWLNRGYIFGLMAQKEETNKSFDKSIQRYQESLESSDKALEIRRDNSTVWHHRSWVLNQVSQYNDYIYREKIIEGLSHLRYYASSEQQQKIQTEVNRLQQYRDFQEKKKFIQESWEKHTSMILEESVASLDEALKFKQDDPSIWYKKGWALTQLKRYDKAFESLDKAVKLKPDDVISWYWRGRALENLKRYEEAVFSYNKIIELKPASYGDTWHYRGWVLFQLQKYKEAIASFDEHLKINKNASNAWYLRGWAFYKLEEYQKALDSFDKAIAIYSKSADYWHYRGVVLHYLKRYDEAIESYKKVLEIDPNYELAKKNIDIARKARGQSQENIFRNILRLAPLLNFL
ncbi:tetratricopeptide repeat protein [Planktothrix sp. FACHB-1355]|uniref:Tetratricopeptide repeat protein n=1 Tax=Aerosakkonema funiforme FACHB-1375 TaxID=2949571 RepID=A0A926ZHS5_9CYAN|nr:MULTISPECIES: serine protease [Oscillatoriales]MBD2183608.1 tetratricopeptide repeat protein [Aerosakkonema funiforme FACHB-1375]MBD3558112.1 tetratricopeptide repeat protein [Planktothrix sp. FACHB-1355]